MLATVLLTGSFAAADEKPQPQPLPEPYATAVTKKVAEMEKGIAKGPYEPNWESLFKVDEAPEWFRDDKFGIYFHWGVYSVPAYGSEWYPRHMYERQNFVEHHTKTYGDPGEYPYTKFVPKFKAEKFDANEWAELFKQAGARYAGPVAEHHDGFALWDSSVTPWNAVDTGPERDLTGELEEAIRERGMRFVATFHHARNSTWKKGEKWTGHYDGVINSYPHLLEDPINAIIYGYMPREQFLDFWLAKTGEVIDQYEPDLIWFDSWLHEIPEPYLQKFLAYYYNR
ncbi:MAG: alpha-L-fucosidase, partial [Rhodospirillales bacterium]|nr:alpha-L-fucosidase [Rhodospirillales bacterium]